MRLGLKWKEETKGEHQSGQPWRIIDQRELQHLPYMEGADKTYS